MSRGRLQPGGTAHGLPLPNRPGKRCCCPHARRPRDVGADGRENAMAPKSASYLQPQFYRLRALRGAKKSICALAASILTISGELYRDLGLDHFDRRNKAAQTSRFVTSWQNLGHIAQSPLVGVTARICLFLCGSSLRNSVKGTILA